MKKAKNIFFVFTSLFLLVFSLNFKLAPSMAQSTSWDSQIGMKTVSESFGGSSAEEDIRYKIVKIINTVLSLLGIIVVILIIYAGFKWMTSAGNEEAVTSAKKILKNAIIGLVIIFMAWSITFFIMRELGDVSSDVIIKK